jgi:hypothetical protein
MTRKLTADENNMDDGEWNDAALNIILGNEIKIGSLVKIGTKPKAYRVGQIINFNQAQLFDDAQKVGDRLVGNYWIKDLTLINEDN